MFCLNRFQPHDRVFSLRLPHLPLQLDFSFLLVVVILVLSYSCKINPKITSDVETFCNIFFTSLPILSKYISIFYNLICTILNFSWHSYFLFYLMLIFSFIFLWFSWFYITSNKIEQQFYFVLSLFLKKIPSILYLYYNTDILSLYTYNAHCSRSGSWQTACIMLEFVVFMGRQKIVYLKSIHDWFDWLSLALLTNKKEHTQESHRDHCLHTTESSFFKLFQHTEKKKFEENLEKMFRETKFESKSELFIRNQIFPPLIG